MLTLIKKFYRKLHSFFVALLVKISPYLATKYLYKRAMGKSIDLTNPKNFNEKIHWLKLYWKHPLVSKCGDKFEMRNYVNDMGLSNILNNIHSVYDDASNIEWNTLPDKFVLKVTSGSGFNIVCKDKNKINRRKVEKKLNKWIKTNFALKVGEINYQSMKPRIICEEFMETEEGNLPIDYKIFCFNGNPKYILVVTEREIGVKRFMFDNEWNSIDFLKNRTSDGMITPKKPDSLQEMIFYAEKLSNPFPFVRVDFYDYNGRTILGEMTFTPDAGLATRYKESFLRELGDMIDLPEKIT
ncbi:ATP-grasp fold amidoligase family protein [Lentibacillus cibarius]|uniref:Glycosyl transferase n=1 Tax=Lentibacillus cibarius TaxID=2583219 RepID=A0A5S3QJM0_9BACI|nr:ATP-grasp fold amidoligase family protein [Lentibacillus cibarius]TMN21929.1 hypothetical protein FFL34_07215 [Lentibacillus cibarius]